MIELTQILQELTSYPCHCYQKDGLWFHAGLLLDNPTVTVYRVCNDPFTDERIVIHTIEYEHILGVGITN